MDCLLALVLSLEWIVSGIGASFIPIVWGRRKRRGNLGGRCFALSIFEEESGEPGIEVMNILAHKYFLQFCIPLIAVGVSVFLKYVTRNDAHNRGFKKEDLAVGLDLAVTALVIFMAAGSTMAQQFARNPYNNDLLKKSISVPWILGAFILGIWAFSTIVRKLGWENGDRLRIFWGILLPDVFGVLSLLFVVNWIG